MRISTEDYLQNQCWIWFTNNHRDKGLFVAIPNDESNPVQSKRKRLTGRYKGAADVVIILNNSRVIWVEFKLPKGVQSEAQKQFEEKIKNLGHNYYVCRSIESFKKIIHDHTTHHTERR